MSSVSLSQRLQALADSYKQTLSLVQELQRFPNSALFAQDPDEKRLELVNDIHQNLKDQEDSLELLRQEVNEASALPRRQSSDREAEHERISASFLRLEEDIKSARSAFRRAQLQAKRNGDLAKRKEREALFASRTTEQPAPKRRGQEKLTQDELALNAAEDVTKSLRRAHELLSGNLQQSQFAQQTLEESSEALKSLSESYGGTQDLLKNSKGLVNQLMRSQKSDTWFLISSTYIMAATIAWLLFRRLLYGPLWWLVWQPMKLIWWTTLASMGAIGFGSSSVIANDTSLSTSSAYRPTRMPQQYRSIELPGKGGGWDKSTEPEVRKGPEMVEKVGQIIDETIEDIVIPKDSPQDEPRNTKKRMMEVDIDPGRRRDEL